MMAKTDDLNSSETSLNNKKTEKGTDEITLFKPDSEEIKRKAETDKERSFKEGLANNSDTDSKNPQQN